MMLPPCKKCLEIFDVEYTAGKVTDTYTPSLNKGLISYSFAK